MKDIVLENIGISFGDNRVLSGLSHVFREGSVTCIEGPSGCGKTTLLNIIAGLCEPDEGSVSGVPEKIAFVFQEDRLCEDYTVGANIRLVCGARMPAEKIDALLAELGLSGTEKKPVRDFSGGMKRRVAIARALAYEGELVILDEPFKGLDDALKKKAMDCVLAHCAGKTLICVTHDSAEAEYLGGEILKLD